MKEFYDKNSGDIKVKADEKFNIISTGRDASNVSRVIDDNNVSSESINFVIVFMSAIKAFDIKSYRKIIRKINTMAEVVEHLDSSNLNIDKILKDPKLVKIFSDSLGIKPEIYSDKK